MMNHHLSFARAIGVKDMALLFLLILLFLRAPVATQGIGYYPLQLAVNGTELLRRPLLNQLHGLGVKTKQKTFILLLGHSVITDKVILY